MNKLTTIKFVIQFNDYTLLQNKYLDLNFTQLTSDLNPRISKFIILLIILIYKYFTRRVTWNKLANGTRGKQKNISRLSSELGMLTFSFFRKTIVRYENDDEKSKTKRSFR